MAELTSKQRLQPSLLDRLTDLEPAKQQEGQDRRVMALERLREAVLRDLDWLLNTVRMEAIQPLGAYPLVQESVVNFGFVDLAGVAASSVDLGGLAASLRSVILRYEPRILPQTLEVRAIETEGREGSKPLTFEIRGQLWAQPLPLRLLLRTEIDRDTGDAAVREISEKG